MFLFAFERLEKNGKSAVLLRIVVIIVKRVRAVPISGVNGNNFEEVRTPVGIFDWWR